MTHWEPSAILCIVPDMEQLTVGVNDSTLIEYNRDFTSRYRLPARTHY
jgi:hypothetical protein